jgi:hypothetical protein
MAIAFGCLGAQLIFAFVCGMLIGAGGGEVTPQANIIIGIIAWGMIISSWIWLSSLSKKPRRVMEEIKEVKAEVVKR